ncbi:two-component system response regulator TorR [Vibrio brasiliensis]|jgi:two-component system torCAD operon response regulator TorR|uniref:DNA-binding transcriptional regulator TorR n=1 Tax=Vibrio brasiliensis LMG 20546 TaxID=945543 RepID=E8LYN2_9VIBR|nr:two-component system response regulator TorR [Vibrio brasiliensis]EGA64183.1 DNA-binding transcriptional regulator TorR [Vibrio brasiliensis LMG 20546]MCG9648844.1 two-component system response regulator TorR [Vibrio brasiliensis]MCG9724390.1 two-component system response regulator TorR [Vibrio brasiliensis]MCG9752700.1 two-component system response regulator TorR [Vibrio brasiliensis]MCG9781423.1 two-component system response regulator TorR [Vibrio brasiliensis]
MSYHVLVVEDDAVTRSKLVGYFQNEGYNVSEAESGEQMRDSLQNNAIDLVMLDINLPGEDGLMLTRELRSQSDIGIILVTGRTDSIDKIVGLEMGADDYVTKPFELRELLVRVKNLLWRISSARNASVSQDAAQQDDNIVRFGEWTFDVQRRALSRNGEPVKLTKAEYELLVALSSYPNQVLSRERILNMISHRVDAPNDRTIDVLIRRMRAKMEFDPKNPQIFVTVHGEGYMFAGD